MDPFKKHNIQTHCQFSKFQSAKKATKILCSVSVFCFLFSYTALFPLFLHFFDRYFYNFYVELFTYSIGRNYIFLLCNGILVFLIKNSGLIDNSPLYSHYRDDRTDENHGPVPELPSETRVLKKEFESPIKQGKQSVDVTADAGDETVFLTQEEDCDGQEIQFLANEEEEAIEELLSTEELNKKCDDFIKKVREGIRFEPQKVIMV